MNTKKFSLTFLISIFVCLSIIAIAMISIDPLFHFHAPLSFIKYELNDERYQNDGIARHFSYDALSTGTSMTENIKTSQIDSLFGTNTIKCSFMGGSYSEIDSIINTALASKNDVRLVIRATDQFDLIKDPNFHISNDPSRDYDYPWFLSDKNILNDVKYVFNKALMADLVTDLFRTKAGTPTTSFDEYAYWGDMFTYSKDTVLSSYVRPSVSDSKQFFSDEDRKLVFDNITQNVISTANAYPNTEFIIWIPPYSIAYYDIEQRNGLLQRDLDAMEYELELLTAVPNIKVYCFADRDDIVCDLNNYKDVQHFSPSISAELIENIHNNFGLITKDNYVDYMTRVKNKYLNYDYESIYNP